MAVMAGGCTVRPTCPLTLDIVADTVAMPCAMEVSNPALLTFAMVDGVTLQAT
jgi:hypothetical protein